MELEELKQKWNMLDQRLSKSEVYNRRMLQEMLRGKNQTHYERLRKTTVFNLFASLAITAVLVPLLHMQGVYHNTSFYLIETVCTLGVLMVGYQLILLSRFDVMNSLQDQLRHLVNYRRYYVYTIVISIPLVIIAICLTLYLENTASPAGIFLVILFLIPGALCSWLAWKKHQRTMQEIESNLAELKEFES